MFRNKTVVHVFYRPTINQKLEKTNVLITKNERFIRFILCEKHINARLCYYHSQRDDIA